MKKITFSLIICIILSFCVYATEYPPVLPVSVWGEATISGEPAEDDLVVTSLVNSQDYAQPSMTKDGYYNAILKGGDSPLTFSDDPDCLTHWANDQACVPCVDCVEGPEEGDDIEIIVAGDPALPQFNWARGEIFNENIIAPIECILHADCDDGLYCNGEETCNFTTFTCELGTQIDCSSNNNDPVSDCNNDPDGNPFTWDHYAGFASVCNEETDSCTTEAENIVSECNETCGAECINDSNCAANSCEETYNDYCHDNKLVEYDNDKVLDSTTITDSCENDCLSCECEDCDTDCSAPLTETYCVKDVCGAECDSNDDCAATDCDNLDGCAGPEGNDWYDYDDVNNDCTDACGCEDNTCSAPTISYNDIRCVECLDDSHCDDNDGWVDTGSTQWVEDTDCTEKEQKQQDYQDYRCDVPDCVYDVTDTRWIDTGSIRNKADNTPCEDGLFCNGQETCQSGICTIGTAIDCSFRDLSEIAECNNSYDANSLTWDYAPAFTSTCNEVTDACELGTQIPTSECNVERCEAECDDLNSCEEKCEAGIHYYEGECNGLCACTYSTETCDDNDGWVDTGSTQWVDTTDCNEKQQKQQEYHDYGCGATDCQFQVTSTRWVDTGSTRFKGAGSACGQARDCPDNSCSDLIFATIYPVDGHDTCDGSGNCVEYSCTETNKYCSDADPDDGINGITCSAACDQDSDCPDTDCDDQDGCYGNHYRDYHDQTETCSEGCLCSVSECEGSYTEYENDPRCVACTHDDNCSYLDQDYCADSIAKHDNGVCVNYECQVQTTEENCSLLTTSECEGTQIITHEGGCQHGICGIYGGGSMDCDDQQWCNGQETCVENPDPECIAGIPVDCSDNNILPVGTCFYMPDNNPFTWDFFSGFVSVCDEVNDVCTTSTENVVSECNETCGAECIDNEDCNTNSCEQTYDDYCEDKALVDFNSNLLIDSKIVTDNCENDCVNCSCEDCATDCTLPTPEAVCVEGLCNAECDTDNDCDKNTCEETFDDECNGNKLLDYNQNSIMDSIDVNGQCDNTCIGCECTNCVPQCPAPDEYEQCVEGICGAECSEDTDCDDGDDYTKDICENDCTCQNIDVPDIHLKRFIQQQPWGVDPAVGERVTFAFHIKNEGTETANNVDWILDTGVGNEQGTIATMASGKTWIIVRQVQYNSAGNYQLTATVDQDDEIEEALEDNNQMTLNVKVI